MKQVITKKRREREREENETSIETKGKKSENNTFTNKIWNLLKSSYFTQHCSHLFVQESPPVSFIRNIPCRILFKVIVLVNSNWHIPSATHPFWKLNKITSSNFYWLICPTRGNLHFSFQEIAGLFRFICPWEFAWRTTPSVLHQNESYIEKQLHKRKNKHVLEENLVKSRNLYLESLSPCFVLALENHFMHFPMKNTCQCKFMVEIILDKHPNYIQ